MIGRLRDAIAAFRGESRAQQAGLALWTGDIGNGRRLINARVAENLALVASAVSVISSTAASLPAFVYRAGERGRQVDETHPLSRLASEGVNEHQSWPDWVEWTMAQVLLRGNALSEIERDGRGEVVALRPIPWENVSVMMLPSGRLAYDVVRITDAWGGSGRPRRLLEGEVFHLRDRSDDGFVGRSRLSRSPAVFDAALSVQEFASEMYRNQATPKGVLSYTAKLNRDQINQVRDLWKEFTGPSNAAKTLILDQSGTFSPVSVSPEDAELLASRRFSAEEVARLFNMPPPLVGIWDHSSFTNSETAGRWFAQFTLAPWCRKIEAEARRSIFSADERATQHLEIDLSGMTRGDYAARWAAHKIAVEADILTRNEVREVEGWNPRAGGDGPVVT